MPATSTVSLTGSWGGNDIALTVTAMTTHVQFDCAYGDLPGSLTADAQGQINAVGTYVREPGGPIVQGAVPDSHPASYTGSVAGPTMVLTIRLTDTDEVIGSFTLIRDEAGRLVPCVLPLTRIIREGADFGHSAW